jgi:Ca-activated chloride channel family protein
VIFLSDGEPADGQLVPEIVETMRNKRIKLSTVGIGIRLDMRLLQMMADRGGGRFHKPQNLDELSNAFRDEAAHIVEGIPVVEEAFAPRITRLHPIVRGFAKRDFPELTGYVGTTTKPRADSILVSHHGDPVLATWRIGLGATAAFTADAGGTWSEHWVKWAQFPRFWAQVTKAMFRANDSDFTVRAQVRGQEGEIAVDAVDRTGAYLNFLPLFAQVHGPGGVKVQKIELPQRDPGRYLGSFAAQERGFYRIEVFRKDRDRPVAVTGAVMSSSPELASRGPDRATLERLATTTGGRVVKTVEELVELACGVPPGRTHRVREAWTGLAVLALLLFVVEIGLRRGGAFNIDPAQAQEGSGAMVALAEKYLKSARDLDAAGDHARAQEQYLRAHSYFLKARRDDEAKKMWEKYRLLEERRGAR